MAKFLSSAVFVAIFAATTASALPTSHSPFFPYENYVLPLKTCLTLRNVFTFNPEEVTVEFWSDENTTLSVTMTDGHYIAQIVSSLEPDSPPVDVKVAATIPQDVVKDAVCADLNRDGKPDFVVTLWHHGNGLGAEFYSRLTVLSSSTGYRFWVLPTMTPSKEDFISYGESEPIVMVTTDFEQTGGHAYYAYSLWTFKDGVIEPADYVDPRFPKWVLRTYKDNHKPSALVTAEQKQSLLQKRNRLVEATELLPVVAPNLGVVDR